MFDHREDTEIFVFIVYHPDDDDDGAGGCHAAGEAADGHEETEGHGAALLVSEDVATAGQNLAENGARQGVGNGDDVLIKVMVADHAAVHEHSLGHRQVGVASTEGEDRRQESVADISCYSRQGNDGREG